MVQIDSVKGSVSRDPGAWMAVIKDTLVGTVGGGHLEFVALGRFYFLSDLPHSKRLISTWRSV